MATVHARTRVTVEQHIALGYTDTFIAARLHIGVDLVAACRLALDEINAEPTEPEEPLPHGDHAGYNRHRAANEPACDACLEGERQYNRDRGRTRARRTTPLDPRTVEDIHRLTDAGVSAVDIATRLRITTRSVTRYRAQRHAA